MDAASNTGVDNVREAIIETLSLVPHRDRYKIFIIDEAHMLSSAAFNALLKTLEEPPPRVVFILATTESSKIPPTIVSRCQRFRFRPLSNEILAQHLASIAQQEKIEADSQALFVLAQASEGAARDAISLLDQCRSASHGPLTETSVRNLLGFSPKETIESFAQALIDKNKEDLGKLIVKAEEEGLDPAQIIKDLRNFFHEIYRSFYSPISLKSATENLKKKTSLEALTFILKRLNAISQDLRLSDSPFLNLELGLFGTVEAASDLSSWVKRLEALEARLSAGKMPQNSSLAIADSDSNAESDALDDFAPDEISELSNETVKKPGPAAHSDLWTQFIKSLESEKPALSSALSKAELSQDSPQRWRLVFAQSFDASQAKKNLTFIQEALSKLAGNPIAIEIAEKAPVRSSAASNPAEESFSKARQILGGRIVKK
jgi:DNA polymerase-3 subunit gamma/tau